MDAGDVLIYLFLPYSSHSSDSTLKVNNALLAQSCPTLCNPMHYSPLGSSVLGTLQARILEGVAIAFSRASS